MGRAIGFFIGLFPILAVAQLQEFRKPFIAMGSAFEIVIVAHPDSAVWAYNLINWSEQEIKRTEQLISSWDSTSETSLLNRHAGKEYTVVSHELRDLILRSNSISALTQGAFDISFAALAGEWDFDKAKRKEWPDSATIEEKRKLIDYRNIWIQQDSLVLLANVGMRIGFGGIGKGYAADKMANALRERGVLNGLVNASGDIYAWGTDAHGEKWKAAVVDPKRKRKIKMWLSVQNQAVVTSGDYEKYKVKDGVRYAHIIDPRTGWPTTGLMSATVIAPRAELADALATAIFVLGVKDGISLINKVNHAECIIIDSDNEIWYSKNVQALAD